MKKKQTILITLVLILLISISIIYNTTTKEVILEENSSSYNNSNINTNEISMYIENDSGEYESATKVPTSGYTLNTSSSYCKVGDTTLSGVSMSYYNGYVSVSLSSSGAKCYLYFDIKDTISIVSVTMDDAAGGYPLASGSKFAVEFDGTCDSPTYYFSIDESTYYNLSNVCLYYGTVYNYSLYAICSDGSQTDIYSDTYTGTNLDPCGSWSGDSGELVIP